MTGVTSRYYSIKRHTYYAGHKVKSIFKCSLWRGKDAFDFQYIAIKDGREIFFAAAEKSSKVMIFEDVEFTSREEFYDFLSDALNAPGGWDFLLGIMRARATWVNSRARG